MACQVLASRGLDHLVIGVRDLDAAAGCYERLGFLVGARNRHPWGTHNRIVQFPGCFLELITVGEPDLISEHAPGRFSFGAFVRDALERGEGISMLVLESHDAMRDKIAFAEGGIGDFEVFFFERQARRPSGEVVRVAFSLAFAQHAGLPHCGFFVCQQHEPQNFWNPAFQFHPNGARTIGAVTLAVDSPGDHLDFLRAFAGGGQPHATHGGFSLPLPRARLDLLRLDSAPDTDGSEARRDGFARLTMLVPDLGPVEARLVVAGIDYERSREGLTVPAAAAFGVAMTFEAG
jgi:Glyoxalase-like domain